MKKAIVQKIGLLLVLPFFLLSCEKWIDPEINVDPNNPSDVSVDLLLPAAQTEIAFQLGGDLMRPSCMWIQQLSGAARQSLTYEKFVYREQDVNNVWYYALYPTALMNCHIIIEKAGEEGSPHYAGVAKILKAYIIGVMTDVWGDLPMSQAFQGGDNLSPGFDSQETLYNTIQSLCDEGISDVQAGSSTMSPGGDDLFYGGDMGLWVKAAWSIKARYALHLSKRNANAYSDALQYLANGFTSNGEDMEFWFGSNNLEEHPTYQFDRDRGDIRVGEKLANMLINANDPRLPQFLGTDDNGGYSGTPPGSGELGTSWVGPYYGSPNSPVPFITYVELLYIKAEALDTLGDDAGAIQAYNDALEASLNKIGVFDQAWFDANRFTGATIDLPTIIWGKYVSMFMQPEVYVDLRRTELLQTLALPDGATLSSHPRRWPYASSEKTYNGGNVPSVFLTSRLWWDVE